MTTASTSTDSDYSLLSLEPGTNNVGTIVDPNNSIYSIIHGYVTTRLSLRSNTNHFSPFEIGTLLHRHRNFTVNSHVITKFKIIIHLVHYKLVPIKKTSLYKLTSLVSEGKVPVDATWTELTRDGSKPYLSHREFMNLIQTLKTKTTGGVAYSISEIRREIVNEIRKVYRKKHLLHQLPATIPESTLNAYVSKIKSQNIFNVFRTISNKTESRSVAEWSMRSTLCYTMVVAATHFFPNVDRTIFHPRKKDLNPHAIEMWNAVEESYNKMLGFDEVKINMMPVLPNLLTTTDEVTIFATTTMVNNEESLYIVAKPTEVKNEVSSSSSRNHYKHKASGDAHCRGVRIVINSTFTAGGLSAPIFVSVFGLSQEEMPSSDIVTIPVPGLTVGSHQDIYSSGVGYLTFVKGSGAYKGHDSEESNGNDSRVNDNDDVERIRIQPTISKESKIAQLYREMVFYPFIDHIRKTKYDFNGDEDCIPDHLQCVSWMDGCNSQLKLITSDENMRKEKDKKIICCKHSAARTAVEQAADTGAMFKILKQLVRSTEAPTSANNSVYHHLEQEFKRLDLASSETESLHLPSHKKKAILLTLSKLPIASSRAYSDHIIKKAFLINGQLDVNHNLVPSLSNCLNTYRGNIEGSCLEDGQNLLIDLYQEVYERGIISEATFDVMGIPIDTNCHGQLISRDFTVVNENRQRAKVLSSEVQIQERKNVVFEARMVVYRKKLGQFEAEDKDYETNRVCEMKLMALYDEDCYKRRMRSESNTNTSILATNNIDHHETFSCMSDRLTYVMITQYRGKINIVRSDMKAFVRVRSKRIIRRGKATYVGVPDLKKDLLVKLVDIRNHTLNKRLFESRPVLPIQ